MAKNRCPLLKLGKGARISEDLPDYCWEKCGQLWEYAVQANQFTREYTVYAPQTEPEVPPVFGPQECRHPRVDLSQDALSLVSNKFRDYVVIDLCADCGVPYGEQTYQFECAPIE